MIKENIVSIIRSKARAYPKNPFNPPQTYPELKKFLTKYSFADLDKTNDVYASVRNTLIELELDKDNIGKESWNPLRELIKPKQKVVIKPNLVRHVHPLGIKGVMSIITHASIIRPIIDYVLLATESDVSIVICDVPLQTADWEKMIVLTGLKDLVEFYKGKGIEIKLLDLRFEISHFNKAGIIVSRDRKIRDPLGYCKVNLGKKSALIPIIKDYKKLQITDYGTGTVSKHHNFKKNEYLICRTILDADLFINVPKMKTHKKAGITYALKNIIGINGDKSWIAHHRSGSVKNGGDEYDKLNILSWFKWHVWAFLKRSKPGIFIARYIKEFYKKFVWHGKDIAEIKMTAEEESVTEGSWYGNDTLWRCIKDLNNILFFADKKGSMKNRRQRNYLCIGDGIIAGEKDGPMECLPKKSGMIVSGFNPVYVDMVAANVMGFNYMKIPQVRESFNNEFWKLSPNKEDEIIWKSNISKIKKLNLSFKPPISWRGKIERK